MQLRSEQRVNKVLCGHSVEYGASIDDTSNQTDMVTKLHHSKHSFVLYHKSFLESISTHTIGKKKNIKQTKNLSSFQISSSSKCATTLSSSLHGDWLCSNTPQLAKLCVMVSGIWLETLCPGPNDRKYKNNTWLLNFFLHTQKTVSPLGKKQSVDKGTGMKNKIYSAQEGRLRKSRSSEGIHNTLKGYKGLHGACIRG